MLTFSRCRSNSTISIPIMLSTPPRDHHLHTTPSYLPDSKCTSQGESLSHSGTAPTETSSQAQPLSHPCCPTRSLHTTTPPSQPLTTSTQCDRTHHHRPVPSGTPRKARRDTPTRRGHCHSSTQPTLTISQCLCSTTR